MRPTSPRVVLASLALLSACASGRDEAGIELDDDVAAAVEAIPGAEVAAARDGVPTFLTGELGRASSGGKLDEGSARTALPAIVARVAPAFRLAATDLRLLGVSADPDGT